jgi:hypothetical protein
MKTEHGLINDSSKKFLELVSCVDLWLPKFLALSVTFNSQMVLCSELRFCTPLYIGYH